MKAPQGKGWLKNALRLKGFGALQMAGTTVHAGRCIARSGGLIHCIGLRLGVLTAMHRHRRQGTRSSIVAVRAHRSPAQLQRQQYQQEYKQAGAGVHPENCSGIPGGVIALDCWRTLNLQCRIHQATKRENMTNL